MISAFAALTAADLPPTESHKYCVIGAGPAGVQLGHFFLTADGDDGAGRDFVLLEREPASGSFFKQYPVHRVLNSINRRFTRSGDLEFNLRHDWNSLLGSERTVGLFTSWSEEYWPPADRLVEYINAFAAPQVEAGRVRYCHTVKLVERVAGGSSKFRLTVEQTCDPAAEQSAERMTCPSRDSKGECDGTSAAPGFQPVSKTFDCQVVVMANGMQKPRIVDDWVADVNKFALRYDQLRGVDPRSFTNKSVLVLGEGNAAGETGDNIRNFARDMVFVSRYRGGKSLRDTRYVGDTRARRTTYLDANTFKSYEGQTAMGVDEGTLVAVGCTTAEADGGYGGKPAVCIFTVEEKSHVVLAPVVGALEGLVAEARAAFGDLVYERKPPARLQRHAEAANRMFKVAPFPAARVLCIRVKALRGGLTPAQMALLPRLRDTTKYATIAGMEFQKPFDVVVTSLGWVYDGAVFAGSGGGGGGGGAVRPAMTGHPKRPKEQQRTYPALTPEFESTNTRGLFVIGAASHGLDRYRYQASGGFIHGFRFNVRTLFRILETRFETTGSDLGEWGTPATTPLLGGASATFPWDPRAAPSAAKAPRADFGTNASSIALTSPVWERLLHRLNNAGGSYEMVGGSLADAILFDCERGRTTYIEDIPEDMLHGRYARYGRLVWSYYYGTSDVAIREKSLLCGVRSARTAQLGSFIHPVLQYFPAGTAWTGAQWWSHKPTIDHPTVYWMPMEGVSRVHLPDQFVWGDWADHETLGMLEMFLETVEAAAAGFCSGRGNGRVARAFDEDEDVKWFTGGFMDNLNKLAGDCWSGA